MNEDLEATLAAHKRELIESAATLYGIQKHYGKEVRQQFNAAFRRLIDTHILIAGVLAVGLLRINEKITPITEKTVERNALFASYVIGMEVCERAIEEGRYVQAHALLRQEMETLAQLKAVTAGSRMEHRSPNVALLDKSLARLYGELSAAAHVSKPQILQAATDWTVSGKDFPGAVKGVRFFPAFIEGVAHRSFGLHLVLTLRLIEELSADLEEHHVDGVFAAREVAALDLAVQLLMAEGVLARG